MSEIKNKSLTIRAPAKINLHLEVIGKRKDGYHELAMIMQSIDLSDILEIEPNNEGHINLFSNNKELSLNEDNLINKAAILLKQISGNKNLGASINLEKNIPIGAGLGGGSSDAAATLIGLNQLWELNLSYNDILHLACKLGSDVPFCVNGGSQFCFGRGEILEKYNFESNYALILLKSTELSISTSEIYKKYSQKYKKFMSLTDTKIKNIRTNLKLKDFTNTNIFRKEILIQNDLQKIVLKENKSVNKALNLLSGINDSLSISMSGSGPSCYAIFDNFQIAKKNYDDNIEIFNKCGFDAWICKFINNGITFN
tara:strand:- start:51 stop:989 length:939 start_codon:yes stop_codon:yes gene_type:complete